MVNVALPKTYTSLAKQKKTLRAYCSNIYTMHKGHSFPAFIILMTGKSKKHYLPLMQEVKKLVPWFSLVRAIGKYIYSKYYKLSGRCNYIKQLQNTLKTKQLHTYKQIIFVLLLKF